MIKQTITFQEGEDKIKDFINKMNEEEIAELLAHLFGVECAESDSPMSFDISPIPGEYYGAFDVE